MQIHQRVDQKGEIQPPSYEEVVEAIVKAEKLCHQVNISSELLKTAESELWKHLQN